MVVAFGGLRVVPFETKLLDPVNYTISTSIMPHRIDLLDS